MRQLIDCHIHTQACGHASGTVAQMVSAAVFTGLAGVVLTEHLPLPQDLDPGGHLAPSHADFERYSDDVRAMRERVKDLSVVVGAEADWLTGRADDMAVQQSAARDAGVEVLLGSVHFLDGWSFDDPANLSEWEGRDVDEVWSSYFTEWCSAARSSMFDVMAHPDLVKKFGHRPSRDVRDIYEEAARAAADGGVLIEFSTAGWRKPVGEPYPGPDLLKAFRRVGVDVTIGSDAHATSEVGYRIEDGYQTLAAAGFTQVVMPLGGGEMRSFAL